MYQLTKAHRIYKNNFKDFIYLKINQIKKTLTKLALFMYQLTKAPAIKEFTKITFKILFI